MTNRPKFIVLEGLDGAGTTTQAHRLHHYCTSRETNSFLTYEPTGGPIGTMIRDVLSGRITDGTQVYTLSQRAMTLLFSADRLAHSDEIRAKLQDGQWVICDRYVYSTLSYQTLDPDIAPEWVAQLNEQCARPDITVFLDVPVDECLRRISERNEGATVFERRDLLETIAGNYERLRDFYRRHYGELVVLDGTRTPDEVHHDIIAAAGVDG